MRIALAILLVALPARAQLLPLGPLLAASESSGAAAAFAYPLDLVTNTFFAAYSFSRKLRSAYSGPLFTVTRASDSATNAISPGADNLPDVTTLLSFLGTNAGQATCVFDQTAGNLNASGANGPLIANSGVVITNNSGRLAATWHLTNGQLQTLSGGWTLPVTHFLVARLNTFTMNDIMVSGNGTVNNAIKSGSTGGIRLNAGAILSWAGAALTATNFYLIDSWTETGTNDFINVNSATATVGTAGDTATSSTLGWGHSTLAPDMTCMEWLVVQGPISAGERATISSNINAFYSIY